MNNNTTANNNNHRKAFNNREKNNESKRSGNKHNDDNSNNNVLKDGQNDRLEKKETLIRTRNLPGLYAFEEYKHCTENKNLKQRPGAKKIKSYRICNTYHGPLTPEWIEGRY